MTSWMNWRQSGTRLSRTRSKTCSRRPSRLRRRHAVVWSAESWEAGGQTITWEMVPYDVQLLGGIVLHRGNIAEMKTGEGKTLVAVAPVYLNALAGMGVHLVTVNPYLAQRDSEWMGPVYEYLGLSVDVIDRYDPHSEGRKNAYNADITYGTNNEFGFDYLQGQLLRGRSQPAAAAPAPLCHC